MSAFILLLLISFRQASFADPQHAEHQNARNNGKKNQSTAIVGTLVDASWFVPADEKQNQVARASANLADGVPAAILPEGDEKSEALWYLLTSSTGLAPYAGKTIKVEGTQYPDIRGIVPEVLYVKDGDTWREVQIAQKTPEAATTAESHPRTGNDEKPKHEDHDKNSSGEHRQEPQVENNANYKADSTHSQESEEGHSHEHSSLWTLPPLHPVLVNFTAALFPAAVISDWLSRFLRRRSLRIAAWWMLLYAAIVTPFTALAGWLWLRNVGDMGHPQMAVHPWLGLSLAIVLPVLAVWRCRFHIHDQEPTRNYLIGATVILLALVIQGHLGATMSFASSQH